MSTSCSGKNAWPELAGTIGLAARAVITRENPNVKEIPFVKDEEALLTTDFRCERVRVLVDPNNIVSQMPIIG